MDGIGHTVDYLEAGLSQFPEGALRLVLVALLGVTFLWSGTAKAGSPWSTAFALVDFGVVRRPHVSLAWIVIIGEIGLSALLLIAPAVSSELVLLASALAACTLFLFAILTTRSLHAGDSFACTCFGSVGEEISGATLLRSTALGLVAVGCAVAGPLGPALALGDLLLVWSAGAAIVGIAVMVNNIRVVAQLPQPCGDGPA